jgi:hypothetical protein
VSGVVSVPVCVKVHGSPCVGAVIQSAIAKTVPFAGPAGAAKPAVRAQFKSPNQYERQYATGHSSAERDRPGGGWLAWSPPMTLVLQCRAALFATGFQRRSLNGSSRQSPSAILCLPAFVSRSSPGNSNMYPSWISRSLCSGGIVRCIGPLAQLRSDTNSSWVSGGADKPCAIPRTYASNCPFSS